MAIDLDEFQTGKIQVIKRAGFGKKNGHTRHNYCEYRTKELLCLLEKNNDNEAVKEVLIIRGKQDKIEQILKGE